MRRKVIAGNWKMNNNISETQNLVSKLVSESQNDNYNCDIIICPPFTSLQEASNLIEGSKIKLGAQNMFYEESGAYTGEISAGMLKSIGCEYVILGHSERRHIFGETDELINKKIKKALEQNLKPIFCIGELLEERENGTTKEVVRNQVRKGLDGVSENQLEHLIIAYEPVWAIGTGKTATPEQAEEVHLFVRDLIKELYSDKSGNSMRIQYGGSVKPENAKELLSQSNIDGALVGGACLKSESFLKIAKSA